MVFLDFWFVVFLPLALLGTWLTPKGWRAATLLFFCLIFHAHYAGPAGMRPILILAAAVYASLRTGKMALAAGGACISAWLFYREPVVHETIGFAGIAAPLAISFFTFEFVHLLADRATGRLKEVPGVRDYLLFLLFFPSLAAGPIKRIEQFRKQLPALGWPGVEAASRAGARIVFGFFLKLVVSSWFLSLLPYDLTANPYDSTLLLGLYSYGYLTVDLMAYSHIAIGVAGLVGVKLPENVRFVYLSRSFTDFWSRWHLSVTQWFRDYVLLPMAGKGGEAWRFRAGVFAALFLSAVWHGSGANILLWGVINATGVVFESWAGRTRAWRTLAEGSAGRVLPGVQWAVFQVVLMFETVLFLYPLDQVLFQLGRGV